MPQSKEVKTEQARLRKRKQRDKESVTLEGVTLKCDIEMVPAEYIQLRDGRVLEVLPERPRYLTLSDGQVLDRTSVGDLLEATR